MSPAKRFIAVRVFPWTTVLFASLFIWIGIDQVHKASASVEWPSVPGTVRTSGVVEDSSSSGSRRSSSVTYHANVVYDYVVEGKAYQGERISYGSYGTGDEERATRIAAGYPEGAAVRVYFQPDDPGESVLEPGTEGVPWFFVAMGSAFALFGLLLARFLPRMIRATGERASGAAGSDRR
ncbi:MAG: DUF3592 domain-containing protein [Rhodocyclaceae bacterium]|nr:DUF3592 domain-containing protein [Rhodocyclaceae bacterium]